MPVWTNIDIKDVNDLKQFNIELNRRIRYYLSHIDITQILFNLNDIGGTLNLSKGGTGQALVAPVADSIFYHAGGGNAGFVTVGTGLSISGTTLINSGVGAGTTATFYKVTSSTANLADISSTNSATFNTIASSSGVFNHLHASSASIGNSTSYTQFESDGTLVLVGDSRTWRDEYGDISKLKVVGIGITEDSTDSTVDFLVSAATNDYVYGNYQLNHDRDLSMYVYPHFHFFQSSSGIPNMMIQYRWQTRGSEKTVAWTNLKMNTPETSYVSGTTLHQIFTTSSGIPAPAATTVSDIIQFRLMRDNSNGSTLFASTDNYSISVKGISFDVHIVTNMLGSREEVSK